MQDLAHHYRCIAAAMKRNATQCNAMKKAPLLRGFLLATEGAGRYCAALTTTFPESSISNRSASITLVQALAKSLINRCRLSSKA